MANSQETSVNLKINRIPDQATLEDMIANDQIEPNQLYMLPSELGNGVVTMQTKVLWTNSSPTSAFAAQTISNLDLTEYDYFFIIQKFYINDDSYGTMIIKKNMYTSVITLPNRNDGNITFRNYYITDSSITISTGRATPQSSDSTAYAIPYQIIGIKLIESPTQITNKYSTNEIIVGEWIDGKKLYRKVIEVTSPSSADTNTNVQEITDLNIETVVDIKATYYSSTSKSWRNIQYITANSDYMNAWVYINNNQYYIRMRTGSNSTSIKVYVTLEYTKTTD